MLEENIIVTLPGEAKERVDFNITIKCPTCLKIYSYFDLRLEDSLDQDLRNPSEDVYVCPHCGGRVSLYKGIKVIDNIELKEKLMCSDGNFVYIGDNDHGYNRIL